jgi:hypothetical protein
MNDTRDGSVETSNVESDLGFSFEELWRAVGERERRERGSHLAHGKVRLECSGEVVDTGSVGPIAPRYSWPGGELVAFDCPRCDRRHESMLLR